MNIPNLLSLSRIFLIPVFLWLLFQPETRFKVIALAVFFIASITDMLDGWSARKLEQESELGEFLDPLADKFLVIATLIAFVIIDPLIPLWMILVIVGPRYSHYGYALYRREKGYGAEDFSFR